MRRHADKYRFVILKHLGRVVKRKFNEIAHENSESSENRKDGEIAHELNRKCTWMTVIKAILLLSSLYMAV